MKDVFDDIGRASGIALILAGPAAEVVGASTAIESELPGLPSSAPKSLGLGSTGRTAPANLSEQLAVEEAMSNPAAGTPIPLRQGMTDPRWPGSSGWIKMRQNVNGHEVHYVLNRLTGAVDDFKLK